jgi:membrane associated rhomboid family serine protease/antitoxin component YwqK of YwqJK toxin-antitoxin module
MEFLKKMPATLTLAVINVAVFGWFYSQYGGGDDQSWYYYLLGHGGLYNPLTLDGQWYRIFTHMFLHGSVLHILVNTYGLISVGQDLESYVGTKKFLFAYFLGGVAGAFGSMYFHLFMLGVGASGAIFALFGYALVVDIRRSKEEGRSISSVIINFGILILINFVVAELVHADNAAHIAGAICGIIFGSIGLINQRPALIIVPLLIAIYFLLPRFQVHYFNFFQEVLAAQDSTNYVLRNSTKKSDDDFLKDYRHANAKWDTALMLLNAQTYIPEKLSDDTFKLRRLLRYHKKEGDYRITMVQNESYIYADSMEIAGDTIAKYNALEYVLNIKYSPPPPPITTEAPVYETTKIWYDSNWVEKPYPPAEYFRVGRRDSLGLWQGPLADYYKTGIIQMKGSYKDDNKDGIFLYYTTAGMHSAAGVYREDQRIGKWETFHKNGQIESEVFYRDRYFLKSYWDSLGVQMVKDGYGTEIHKYSNGVVASEGKYVDGYQEGYWYGKHANGEMYFEENYNRGRLINGRSKSKTGGRLVVYDETTFFALPEGGFKKLNEYLHSSIKPVGLGTVKMSFRVTTSGQMTDFKIEKSVSKELDFKAKQVILAGPRWLPARLHGQEPTDGFAVVSVEF